MGEELLETFISYMKHSERERRQQNPYIYIGIH